MTWRCFAYNGVGSIMFALSKMNSQVYQCVLESHLLLNAEFLARENLKFQQDNAPVHTSNSTKHSFLVNNVKIFK